ncbi:MAG: ribokinase [Fulvimarina manganoxydans]|uniref:PfkB family carbohydrate kinase n=1 Tax=Fulvimarina manganoxydans TaxID=937218 RepID=UPI002357BC75|nr:PfkB family carbohydrate kinase [Fulvimarina manganoxydans]MCK5932954.1 ribokinase [Fulvimarina manganoxydans]
MVVQVIGNVGIDETFAIEALPMPGESILGRSLMRDLGGKAANQAVVLTRAGCPVRFVSACGRDERGADILKMLTAEGCETGDVLLRDVASDISVIFSLPGGENCLVTTTSAVETIDEVAVIEALGSSRSGDWLVLQGNLTIAATGTAIAIAREKGLATAFNPSPIKPGFEALFGDCELVIVNESEAEAFTGRSGQEAARAIVETGARNAVVTLGDKGCVLFRHDGETLEAAPAPATVVDTTGAGDSFAAMLLAARLRRKEFDIPCLTAAARGAALTIGRLGCRPAFPTRAEIAEILDAAASCA